MTNQVTNCLSVFVGDSASSGALGLPFQPSIGFDCRPRRKSSGYFYYLKFVDKSGVIRCRFCKYIYVCRSHLKAASIILSITMTLMVVSDNVFVFDAPWSENLKLKAILLVSKIGNYPSIA